jgi:biopolymer transport protein ExbD
VILGVLIIVLVGYLTVTHKDVESDLPAASV